MLNNFISSESQNVWKMGHMYHLMFLMITRFNPGFITFVYSVFFHIYVSITVIYIKLPNTTFLVHAFISVL